MAAGGLLADSPLSLPCNRLSEKTETPSSPFQACVRRRAELSVSMNPSCQGPGKARRAIDKAFEACFKDTAPFDR